MIGNVNLIRRMSWIVLNVTDPRRRVFLFSFPLSTDGPSLVPDSLSFYSSRRRSIKPPVVVVGEEQRRTIPFLFRTIVPP